MDEGKLIARSALQVSLDVADSKARAMASAVTMWHSSWLQSLSLPLEVQQTVEDLLFKGPSLFS